MQIEAGKYYKTRDGRKTMTYTIKGTFNGAVIGTDFGNVWLDTGEAIRGTESGRDLVAPWNEGPIRTVTRREIVPGDYGAVRVTEGRYIHCRSMATAEELREAAHILNQLAEVLEDV